MFIVVFLGSSLFFLATLPFSYAATDPVFVGAGDIATCDAAHDSQTADLLDTIAGTVFTLGDNVYNEGTSAQFTDCYEPTWGRHKARTKPVPGNHEYLTAGAAGYFTYFGDAASPAESNCKSNCKGYYSYDLGAWHIIALNSEIDVSAGSAQEKWLRADLAAHPNVCTLAYWHEPRFSSGETGDDISKKPLWDALYAYGADVVLNGHAHDYERFAPQDPSGQADPQRGIREFVVGTGGGALGSFPTAGKNIESRSGDTWGVLKLTLHATSYSWEFVPVAGQSFQDSGSDNCVEINTATPVPTPTHTPTHTPTPTDKPTVQPTPTKAAPATATPPPNQLFLPDVSA
jgi:hypothetical protein